MLGNLSINAIFEEAIEENLSGICPSIPGSVLNNWTAEEIPQDMCLDEHQDFEDDRDCNLSPDLLKMVEQEEKQILPHKESVEIEECKDLNKASPKDNFSLPHIDILVDSTAGYSLLSFMDGFSGYNQMKMHLEDMEKTTIVTMWGTFCYKVMPFGLKNARVTYQRAMVILFHDMMLKEIEVYVDE
ncbi:RNA-directed DNA polymerase-like protein [Gossypium australe]|uniref:RNA-directed DNA polymerase-like protein n=1 Tax=Gossypium australe TaxID=47621 RepID=A0A5B6V7G0_9ROSI|nr:RNA-directed DNA polymerase-like protein [Gossypium australe]